jgi:hypothetical protein
MNIYYYVIRCILLKANTCINKLDLPVAEYCPTFVMTLQQDLTAENLNECQSVRMKPGIPVSRKL